MLVRTKNPSRKPDVGAIHESPLRMWVGGRLYPRNAAGKA
jgi:hypothetical protein